MEHAPSLVMIAKSDGAGEGVRANQERQLKREHGTDDFVTPAAKHELTCVGVVRYVRELDLDRTDDVTGVDSHKTETNAKDNTGDHTEGGEGGGERQTAEGDGLDDEDDGETLPAEAVEVGATLGSLLLFEVLAVEVGDLADYFAGEDGIAGELRGDGGAVRGLGVLVLGGMSLLLSNLVVIHDGLRVCV